MSSLQKQLELQNHHSDGEAAVLKQQLTRTLAEHAQAKSQWQDELSRQMKLLSAQHAAEHEEELIALKGRVSAVTRKKDELIRGLQLEVEEHQRKMNDMQRVIERQKHELLSLS